MNQAQAAAWSRTAVYLAGRIQDHPEQKPGRAPDMSPPAAAAMRAVLHEVGSMAVSATLAAAAPHWLMLRQLADGDVLTSQADGAAAAHSHKAREGAARRLIENHEDVLRDVTNPSPSLNIIGAPLTQLELERLDIGLAAYADQAMREVARRLLGRRPGSRQLAVPFDPLNHAQAAAWSRTAIYLDGRIQATPDQKPGRTPDMEPHAAAAMKAVLHEVGMSALSGTIAASTADWAMLQHLLEKPVPPAAEAADEEDAREWAAARREAGRRRVVRTSDPQTGVACDPLIVCWEPNQKSADWRSMHPADRVSEPRGV